MSATFLKVFYWHEGKDTADLILKVHFSQNYSSSVSSLRNLMNKTEDIQTFLNFSYYIHSYSEIKFSVKVIPKGYILFEKYTYMSLQHTGWSNI